MQTPNELLPDGLQMDLLWTNASLESEFASQTIPLDLSKYKYFCFSAMNYKFNTSLTYQTAMSTIGIVDSLEGAMCVTKYRDNAGSRFAKATKTGVIFSDAYPNLTSDRTVNNTRTIPYRIYGII